ncbi:MAG: MarR family transcriptional regulator [Bdellovibrionales bacterium]|nr:MarR family transcriptional regulator [Bdellovibrionales bacterium]
MAQNDNVQSIRHYSRRLVRELGFLSEQCLPLGMSHTECHSLIEIDHHGMLTVGELANTLRLDKSTMSRAVKTMEEQGLLEACDSGSDKRKKPYRLTPIGRKQLSEIHHFANTQVEETLSGLDMDEQEKIRDGLSLYAQALSKHRARSLFTIRKIENEDESGVAHVIQAVMPEFGCSGPGYALHDPEVQAMYTAYKGKDRAYFVVEREHRIVGGAGFAPLQGGSSHQCELRKMYLLSEARGYGIGDELLKTCHFHAQEAGYTYCYLETTSRMLQAQRLYEKFGFQRLKKPMGDTGHFACDAWYGKDLLG